MLQSKDISVAEQIRKHDRHICCLQETLVRPKDLHRLKVRGWKKIFQANRWGKKPGVAIHILHKIDFKTKLIQRDTGGHFIILKGRIHQYMFTYIINIYAPNIGAPKYIRKILEDFKKHIDSNTIRVGQFYTPLSTMDRSSKQIINRNIAALNDTLGQMGITDIYRIFRPPKAKYTFF